MRNYATAALLLALLLPLTPQAVAARCAGESSGAVAICACTVRNRIAAGWAEGRVLESYYAADQVPTAEQITQATDGLAGVGCTNEYFLFSRADIRKLGLRADCAVASGGGVWAFAQDALRVCRGGT
jgi:hypothetical protein